MSRIGVIDCGSNSFTLVVAELGDGGWNRRFANSIPVGLGAGGFQNQSIRPDRFARGLDALGVFHETLCNYGVDAVYATGTSALRDARNAKDFVAAAKHRFDLTVEVISGRQEAYAIWKGLILTEPLRLGELGLVMDIGGGSVEFVIWEQTHSGPELRWLESVDAGVVRIKDLARPADPLLLAGTERLDPFLNDVLAPVDAAIAAWKPSVLVGSSGSFDAFAALLRAGEPEPQVQGLHAAAELLDRQAVGRLHGELLNAGLDERLAWKGMPASRAPYLPLSSVLITRMLERMEVHGPVKVLRSPYALREGLVELAREADLAPSLERVWPKFNP